MVKNKLCALVMAAALMPAVAAADTVTVKADHPDRYIVQKGDTLWDISGRFLKQPWLWPEVWEANPQIENPHLIYPGDEVTLRYRDGRPILSVGRRVGKGTVRLSPEVRVQELDTAIPTIPIDVIQQFLSRPRVVTEEQIDSAPYVVSVGQEALIGKPGKKIYARGIGGKSGDKFSIYRKGPAYLVPKEGAVDSVSARGRGLTSMWSGDGTETPARGREGLASMWGVYGDGRERRKTLVAEDREILGYEAIHVADAVLERSGDPATLIVTSAKRELLGGDRLFPIADEEINSNFMPRAPSGNVNGQIISVVNGVSQIGQYQIVVVNLGQSDGIKTGHVMAVYQRGELVEDLYATPASGEDMAMNGSDSAPTREGKNELERFYIAVDDMVVDGYNRLTGESGSGKRTVRLPDERAGTVMVFRPYENFSYALVMEATRAMHVNDAVKNP